MAILFQKLNFSLVFLIIVWAISQTIAYFHFQMRASVDSDLYIGIANNLLEGNLPTGREIFYSSYGFLIAIPLALGLHFEFILAIQFGLALLALVCLYKMTYQISKSPVSAFLTGLFYVAWFKFQQWNLIVYTDSSFAHLVVISMYLLHFSKSKTSKLFAILLVIFTAFVRPTGMALLFAVFVYLGNSWIQEVLNHKRKAIVTLLVGFLGFLISLNFAMSHYIGWFVESYGKAEIIYPNESLFVEKPTNFIIPDENSLPIVRLIAVFLQNPSYMFKITALKMALFLGHIKPYYSFLHNLFIGTFLYPIYLLAIRGFWSFPNSKLKKFIATFILFQILTVSFTSENWDGRFLLPTLPWFFLLASVGLGKFINQYKLSRK